MFCFFFLGGGAGVHTFRSSFIRVMQCALHGYVKMQDHVSPDINFGPNLALAQYIRHLKEGLSIPILNSQNVTLCTGF